MENKNAWEKYPEGARRENVMNFAEDYRRFLSRCKTERECILEFETLARQAGFLNLDTLMAEGRRVKAGDKIYASCMGKAMALFVIGKQGLEKGMRILGMPTVPRCVRVCISVVPLRLTKTGDLG